MGLWIFFNQHFKRALKPSTFIMLKSFSILRFFNYWLIKLQFKFRTLKVIRYPYEILIDPCNLCTLHRPLCPTDIGDRSRRKALLSFELFKRITDEIGPFIYSITSLTGASLFLTWISLRCCIIVSTCTECHLLNSILI